jgi:arylsulfatase A-like enzyme
VTQMMSFSDPQARLFSGRRSGSHFGKCHEVPMWQTSPMGPFDKWPTGSGLEHFYRFIGGEDNQWYPAFPLCQSPVN